MAKLYFKYGAMGSAKTAQALITKFNYEERGMKVMLIKPATDNRSGRGIVESRIGLSSTAEVVSAEESIIKKLFSGAPDTDVIIVDEAQFLTPEQVDELKLLGDKYDIPAICFGLRTDFLTHLFPGSKRLMEIAESITEIKTMCECGRKATVNARIDGAGHVITEGEQVMIGGNESYVAMCHRCWKRRIEEQQTSARK